MTHFTAYLDTCIVSGLAKEDLKPEEQNALQDLLTKYKKGEIGLLTSEITREELRKIPNDYRILHEVIYNLLKDVPISQTHRTDPGLTLMGVGGGTREDPIFTKLKKILPGEDDARHLFQAAKNKVIYFLTTDSRTILKFKKEIEDITGVKAVTPLELLNNI
jgi:hypothetical protein